MTPRAPLAIALGAILGVAVLLPALQARPATQRQFHYVYRTQPKTNIYRATCELCHEDRTGGRGLNKYGEDLKRAGRYGRYQFEGYRAIEKLDSDKDGFTNAEEIAADKLPGSRVSRPKPEKKQVLVLDDETKKKKKGKGKSSDQPPSGNPD